MHYLDSMKKKQSEDLVCFQLSRISVTIFFKILNCYKILPFLTACLIQAWKVCCSADKHGFFIRHFFFYFHEYFVMQKMNLSSFYIKHRSVAKYIKHRSVAKTFSMKLI